MDATVGFLLLMHELVAVIPQLIPVFLLGMSVKSVLSLKEQLILSMDKMLVVSFGG
jgi:hypothetical protein